jgi:hypothetical protein
MTKQQLDEGAKAKDDAPDVLVPDAEVRREFGGITSMGLWRWDNDKQMAALGWPPPLVLRGRKYRSRRKLEAFKAALVRRSLRDRKRLPHDTDEAVQS